MNVIKVDINKIIVDKNQPRQFFDDSKLAELASSIKKYGLLQPIIVKKQGEGYMIIAGERRFRACKLAGLSEIDVIVNEGDRYTANAIAVIENIQREDLSAIEEAQAYQNLIKNYELSQADLSMVVGKKQSTISNKLRLLKLNKLVQAEITCGKLTERHGRALLKLDEEKQVYYMKKAIEKDYTVSVLEREIAKSKVVKKPATQKRIVSKDFKLAVNTLNQAVMLIEKTGLNVNVSKQEQDDELEFIIKISKES